MHVEETNIQFLFEMLCLREWTWLDTWLLVSTILFSVVWCVGIWGFADSGQTALSRASQFLEIEISLLPKHTFQRQTNQFRVHLPATSLFGLSYFRPLFTCFNHSMYQTTGQAPGELPPQFSRACWKYLSQSVLKPFALTHPFLLQGP